ncbi:MAG: DUF4174 domain-containing protein, partial [Bacteroidota bacterium]
FIFLLGYLVNGQNLDNYLWKKRVVIVFSPFDNHPKVKEQLDAFKPFSREIEDREMIILIPQRAERPKLLERFRLDNDYVGLILVGKDGGVKLKQKLVVTPKTLFDLIDAMPMRRAELRNKSKKPD